MTYYEILFLTCFFHATGFSGDIFIAAYGTFLNLFFSFTASRNSVVVIDHSLCIQFLPGGLLSGFPYFAVSM